MGYYYKNEEESDHTVSIAGMHYFDSRTSTKQNKKRSVAFPEVGSHVIASDLQSKDIETVIAETSNYIEEVLKIEPIKYK